MKKNPHDADAIDPSTGAIRLETTLREVLVDAAILGQTQSGRGMLRVLCDTGSTGSVTWEYKPVDLCAEELDEWPMLAAAISGYDPARQVVIALMNDGLTFFMIDVT